MIIDEKSKRSYAGSYRFLLIMSFGNWIWNLNRNRNQTDRKALWQPRKPQLRLQSSNSRKYPYLTWKELPKVTKDAKQFHALRRPSSGPSIMSPPAMTGRDEIDPDLCK